MKILFIPILLLAATIPPAVAQHVMYADVNKADVQRMNFEIIGKIANNYLVYKEVKGNNFINVYNESMSLLEEVPINNLPDAKSLLDLSFFAGHRSANMIYQFQQGNTVYAMAAMVEPNGRVLQQVQLLDSTTISYKAGSKIYNTIASADGNRIMLFKINRKDRNLYQFTTMLYDKNMALLHQNIFTLPMQQAGYRISSYQLTNDGKLIFVKYNRLTNSGNITDAVLIEKPANNADINTYTIGNTGGTLFLDDIKLQVDEDMRRYITASLYSNSSKGNIIGMYVAAISMQNGQKVFENMSAFDNSFRKRAKSGGSLQSVFDDFFINNIVSHRNGGFTISAEALSSNGDNSWSRWGYGSGIWGGGPWYGGWGWSWGYWSPHRFYSPYFYHSYWWGGPWAGWGNSYSSWKRYNAGNILVISFDTDGNKQWDNVIVKRQSDTETDGRISYQVVTNEGNMHFLINNEGKISTLENITIQQNGTMQAANAIEAKDKYTDFMPRYGRQVSPDELIIPYRHKNNISFAKVTW